jgi:hypothetical protein
MTPNLSLTYADSELGARYILEFRVKPEALAKRVPAPFQLVPGPLSEPNLMVVFNDLLLNLKTDGKPDADESPRYVGFVIFPVANPETSERGAMHFRNYSGDRRQSPGHYKDAVYAPATWEQHIIGDGTSSTVDLHARFEPETGGCVELRLKYRRSLPSLVLSDKPNFPAWAARDPKILRVYQQFDLIETIWRRDNDLQHLHHVEFRAETPELQDIFDGSEQLINIIANPIYTRKVFAPSAPAS